MPVVFRTILLDDLFHSSLAVNLSTPFSDNAPVLTKFKLPYPSVALEFVPGGAS